MTLLRRADRLSLESIQLEKMMTSPAGFPPATSRWLTPFAALV
jgi:hypothetical protein